MGIHSASLLFQKAELARVGGPTYTIPDWRVVSWSQRVDAIARLFCDGRSLARADHSYL